MVTYHCAMTYSSESIAKKFPSLVIEVRGKHCEFSHTSDPQSSDSDSLVFLSNSELLPEAAAVVAGALQSRGIASNVINTAARGENDLAKATRDGVREPLNRRSEVTIVVR